MKNPLKLIIALTATQLVGLSGTPFTLKAIPTWYASLNKPFFNPPNWVFGPVWTLLYLLMGISLYLIWKQTPPKPLISSALKSFLIQLALNFAWTPIFFGLRSPKLGLIIIVTLLISILITLRRFYPLSRLATYLLLPYLLWVSFASILNLAIVWLN